MDRYSNGHSNGHNYSNGHSYSNGHTGVSRDPQEIQQQIHRTRNSLERTLEAIEEKLTPKELLSEAFDYFSNGNGPGPLDGAFDRVTRTIRENPVPSALIGLGVVALLRGNGSSSGGTSDYARRGGSAVADGASRAAGAVSGGASRAAGAVKSGASAVRDASSSAAQSVSSAVSTAGSAAGGAASRVASAAGSAARTSADGVRAAARATADSTARGWRYAEERPVLLGALGLAVGALVGASIPRTRFEDDTFGDRRDELVAQARDTAAVVAEGAQDIARATLERAETEVRRSDLDRTQARDAVKAVADGVRAVASDSRDKVERLLDETVRDDEPKVVTDNFDNLASERDQ